MGSPTIWWHPDSNGTLETTAIGKPLSATRELPYRDRSDAVTLSGLRSIQLHRKGMRVLVLAEGFQATSGAGLAMERNLFNILEHLRDGRTIGLAADASQAWCGYARQLPKRGDTSIKTGGNTWWTAGTGTIANGEQLVIESANPIATREVTAASGATTSAGQTVSVDEVAFTYEGGPCWVRHRLYFPLLYMPEDQLGRRALTTNWRRRFTFEVELEIDYHGMTVLEAFDSAPISLTEADTSKGKRSADSLLALSKGAGPISSAHSAGLALTRIRGL